MKLEKIDLNLLKMLDAVVRTGSVSRAATAVGLSKPAASHALARLRTQLGDPILVRAGQRYILTDHARAIGPRVTAALDEARAVLSAERPFDAKTLRREFRILATDQVLSLVGLRVGQKVSAVAPDVALRFVPLDLDLAGALGRDADLAIGVMRTLPAELSRQRLFEDRFAVVARRGHPEIRGALTMEQYLARDHVAIAPRGDPGSVVDAALAARKLRRRAVRWVPYYLTALELVAESDCIATMSERLALRHADRFGLDLFEPPFPLPAGAVVQVWHPRIDAEPGHAWLRGVIASVARQVGRPRSRARTST